MECGVFNVRHRESGKVHAVPLMLLGYSRGLLLPSVHLLSMYCHSSECMYYSHAFPINPPPPPPSPSFHHHRELILLLSGGHDELVELLLAHGADIEHRDKKGCTPLILAASAGHAVTVAILLDHNADIEAQSDRTKDTALSLACSGGRQEVGVGGQRV